MTTSILEEKTTRFRAFWARENRDRPLVAFTGSYYPRETLEALEVKEGRLLPGAIDVDRFVRHCEGQARSWEGVMGDGIWAAAPLWGVPWVQAIFGRDIRVGMGSIWNDHAKVEWEEIERLCDFRESPWFRLLMEVIDRMVGDAKGRYSIGTLITPGILVVLAELRGMEGLVYDIVDEPERVERAMVQLTDAFLGILDACFERIPPLQGGYGSHTRGVWAPGRQVEYDEDSNFLLNPAMQKRIVMPSHRRIMEKVPFGTCHLHSTRLHTLDNLLADERIPHFELCPDEGYDLDEIIVVLRKILEAGRCVITHAFFRPEEVDRMIESLPPEGLYIGVRAESPAQAEELQKRILGTRGWA